MNADHAGVQPDQRSALYVPKWGAAQAPTKTDMTCVQPHLMGTARPPAASTHFTYAAATYDLPGHLWQACTAYARHECYVLHVRAVATSRSWYINCASWKHMRAKHTTSRSQSRGWAGGGGQ